MRYSLLIILFLFSMFLTGCDKDNEHQRPNTTNSFAEDRQLLESLNAYREAQTPYRDGVWTFLSDLNTGPLYNGENSSTSLIFRWDYNDYAEEYLIVKWDFSKSAWDLLGLTKNNYFEDSSLQPNTKYRYVVMPLIRSTLEYGFSQGSIDITTAATGSSSSASTSTTSTSSFLYRYPIGGSKNIDWYLSNYLDADSRTDFFLDYLGGIMTYDGHTGGDFIIKGFAAMDQGVDAICARSGNVTSLHDGEYDRQEAWDENNKANYVEITHSDGTFAYYYHLRKNSIIVTLGQKLNSGDKIGLVGSSGFSDVPHMHFSVFNKNGSVIDYFKEGLIDTSNLYPQKPFFFEGGMTQENDANLAKSFLNYPPHRLTTTTTSQKVYFWYSVIGAKKGDQIYSTLSDSTGKNYELFTLVPTVDSKRYNGYIWTTPKPAGSYTLKVGINESPNTTFLTFTITQ